MTADEQGPDTAAIRARCEAATPGPWVWWDEDYMGCGQVYTMGEHVMGGNIAAPSGDLYPRSGYNPQADMRFVAAARQDVPDLCDALDRARTERDTALAERDGLKCLLESSILKGQGYCGARHWNGGTCFHPAGHPEGHPEHFGDEDRLRAERDTARSALAQVTTAAKTAYDRGRIFGESRGATDLRHERSRGNQWQRACEKAREELSAVQAAVVALTAERGAWIKGRNEMAVAAEKAYERQRNAEAAVVTARRDAWDEGFDAGERDVFEHDRRNDWGDASQRCIENPYRARASTQPAEGSGTPPGNGSHLREQGPTGRREPTVAAGGASTRTPAERCEYDFDGCPSDCPGAFHQRSATPAEADCKHCGERTEVRSFAKGDTTNGRLHVITGLFTCQSSEVAYGHVAETQSEPCGRTCIGRSAGRATQGAAPTPADCTCIWGAQIIIQRSPTCPFHAWADTDVADFLARDRAQRADGDPG